MNTIIRNVLAVFAGILIGGLVNMLIIMMGGQLIPPPPGADMTTAEGIAAAMPNLSARHFVMPFLAHALGTFAGALAAALIAATYKTQFALGIGVFFLLGGIAASAMIPAPVWFIALDLILAYIPPAIIAGKLAGGRD